MIIIRILPKPLLKREYESTREGAKLHEIKVYESNVYYIIILFTFIAFIIYWYYVRPNWYKKIHKKLLQFQGFKYSHLTNQEEEQEITPAVNNTNCHFSIFGRSGSGKTSFLKYYLDQTKSD